MTTGRPLMLPEVESAVVRELGRIDRVAARGEETTCLPAAHTLDNHQVVADDDRAGVEQDVIVRAKAQHIRRVVGTVVRASEGAHVGSLGVRASRSIEANAADLAPEVMELLHVLGNGRVANDPLDCRLYSLSRLPVGLQFLAFPRRRPWIVSAEQESPDLEARPAGLGPVPFDTVEAIVAKPDWGSESRRFPPSSDDADRQSIQAVLGQRLVPSGQRLVGNLTTGLGVIATMPGVDDLDAAILIIFVSPIQDNRVRAFGGPA
jgi:hypothetical protein